MDPDRKRVVAMVRAAARTQINGSALTALMELADAIERGEDMADAVKCTCGSGAHPRRCKAHPDHFDAHVAELNRESADEVPHAKDCPLFTAPAQDASPRE